MNDHSPVRGMGHQLLQQLPLLVALMLLWLFLWGAFTPLDVVTAAAVAILVTRVFELPPVSLSGRFNPWWLLVFLVDFAWRMVAGSVEVAVIAFRSGFGFVPKSSVVEVKLVSRSDFVLTLVSIAQSLVPGTLILEVDRANSTLFLHVLGADSGRQVDKVHRLVHETEVRILRALGSRDELEDAESRSGEGASR